MRAPNFSDVFDAALRHVPAKPTRVFRPWRASDLPRAAVPFLFTRPLTSATPGWPAQVHTGPRRPAHPLTKRQGLAFDTLLALGARLSADFTAGDLQREYRRLAKRYHPDRHGAASARDRDRMARQFVDATESYRCLCVLVDGRH